MTDNPFVQNYRVSTIGYIFTFTITDNDLGLTSLSYKLSKKKSFIFQCQECQDGEFEKVEIKMF